MPKHPIQFEYGPHPDDPDDEVTHGILGGSSLDIERSILADTYVNTRIIGKTVKSVKTITGSMGAGTLQDITIGFDDGTELRITGIGLRAEVNE